MTGPRKIAVVTGSRAEYGLLRPVLDGIRESSTLTLQLLVTGSHLDDRFGATWRQIAADGFHIDRKIPLQIGDGSPRSTSAAMAAALDGLAAAYDELRPDLVLLLGDRYEILSAAAAALPFNIPLGHIHGGEVTEGAIDDCFRHAISKMANLHFVAAEPYAVRLVRMGERPEHVFVVGAPGLDALTRQPVLGRAEVEARIGIHLAKPCFLVTYHPLTMDAALSERGIMALTGALEEFPEATIVFTGTNADPGFGKVVETIDAFVQRHADRVRMVQDMGQHLYLSTASHVDAVIGNSSSGIIEIPSLGIPTINIGDRQKGRLRSASVIDCPEDQPAISGAIRKVLSEEFRSLAATATNPYGSPGAGARIVRLLEKADFSQLRRKPFYDGD